MNRTLTVLALCWILNSCGSSCLPYYTPAMIFEVYDSNTKELLCNLTVIVEQNDEIYELVDSTEGSCENVHLEPPTSSAGIYKVTVEKDGYVTWEKEIEVKKIPNDCHVYTELVVVTLQKE